MVEDKTDKVNQRIRLCVPDKLSRHLDIKKEKEKKEKNDDDISWGQQEDVHIKNSKKDAG